MSVKPIPLMLAALLLTLVGCSKHGMEMVVSTNNWLGYQPLYLARDLGYFGKHPIHLVQLASNTETIRSFRNGRVQAAGLTLDETLLLAESGIPVCIPLIMDFSNGADTLLGKGDVDSLPALEGKRVGVENTAVGAHMLIRALDKGGLTVADVTVIPLEVHEQRAAFEKGRIDALVTFEPLRSQLLAAGAHELFTSADIPGEITDVLVVRRDFFEDHHEEVDVLLDAWYRVLDQGFSAEERAQLANYTGLSGETLASILPLIEFPGREENRSLLSGDGERFEQTLSVLNDTMLERGLIHSRIDAKSLRCPLTPLKTYR